MEGITAGDTTILSQAITLIESSLVEHREIARKIIERCQIISARQHSMRIGITGVPGAGKSTFIEAFGSFLTSKGYKLAVLAIDPSSERSKGSILGDKTRMETLCNDPNAFISAQPPVRVRSEVWHERPERQFYFVRLQASMSYS